LKERENAKKGGKENKKKKYQYMTLQHCKIFILVPMEEMSELYMAINTLSQILAVIF